MLKNYSIIKISGPDAEKFLQGQLSNDITELKKKPWQLSCYCNQKGRIISFLWLALYKEAYYLCLPGSAVELTLVDLKKFGAFSRVEIQLIENLKLLAIFEKLTDKIRKQALVCMDYSPDLSLALVEAESKITEISDADRWELGNINNELPIIFKEQQEKFTPHQLNLQHKNALAFKKGCYRGQEIVARMEYLGKLKQQMVRVEISGSHSLETLTLIQTLDGDNIGEIVNIKAVEKDTYLALAVLNKAAVAAANIGIILLKNGQELKIL
jgi:hypothetical protein